MSVSSPKVHLGCIYVNVCVLCVKKPLSFLPTELQAKSSRQKQNSGSLLRMDGPSKAIKTEILFLPRAFLILKKGLPCLELVTDGPTNRGGLESIF
eukprot:1190545-Prorocentrum_minimum.AAC.2